MSAIYDLKTWKEIARRSTSGDQVWDILASWESNTNALTSRIVELEGVNIDLSARLQAYRDQNKTIAKLEAKIARLVEVGDKIYEEAKLQDPFTDEKGMAILEAWNKEAHE